MSNRNSCPKCSKPLKPTYMKQTCPYCGTNLMYYKMDERLKADAIKAQQEVDAVSKFLDVIKNSCIKTPWHIVRLVMFFLPLASMCLPMYYAGHKNISLITFIMSIINHGFDFGAITGDKSYLFAVLAMVMVVLLSIVVIIGSCFSVTKRGFRRNFVFSMINTAVFGALSILVCTNGGALKSGFYVTIGLYALDFVLHYVTATPKTTKRKITTCVSLILCVAIVVCSSMIKSPEKELPEYPAKNGAVRVVSFNVASAFGTSLEDTGSINRYIRFYDYMQKVKPDLIGTQELNSNWAVRIEQQFGDYELYAVKRGGDSDESNSEMNGIMWNTEVFDKIESNTIWLSQTPEEESIYTYVDENGEEAQAGCNRICSYAVLKEKSSEKLILFMNTHLDNASEQARTFGVSVIIDRIEKIKSQYSEEIAVILSGDFNESEGEAYDSISSVLNDTTDYSVAKATYQEWGYRQTGDKPIDFIFTNRNNGNYTVLDDISSGYVSDHYGIMTDINI